MINEKDVIRIKLPYPGISDKLAVNSHMYICKTAISPIYEIIKCQTLKPHMLYKHTMLHYVDEKADIRRNPFQKTTRIDCDKLFITKQVHYDDALKTTTRPDICKELFFSVLDELHSDGYIEIKINEDELIAINPLISKII